MVAFWALVALVANMLVGCAVFAGIDDDEQSLFAWYRDCPEHIAWWAQPLTLNLWPVFLWLWIRR